jgi:hypothetical protein
VCDDARKPFLHVPPLARFWNMIDNWVRQVHQWFLFLCHNLTTLGLIGNSLWEVFWNQGQYCDGAVFQYFGVIRHLFRPIFTRQAVIH